MGRIQLALLKSVFRLWLILMLVGLIFSFGHIMTPREPDAFARVYLDAADSLSSEGVPEYMKFNVDEGKVQEVYLNDNHLLYTLGRTDKNVTQLLDYYENLYTTNMNTVIADPVAVEALLKTVPDKKSRDEHRRRIAKTTKILNERFVRVEGDGWGAFSATLTGKEGAPDYHADLVRRLKEMEETGLASSLGDSKMVVAFPDPSTDSTQYFSVWPDEDFDIRKMRTRGDEDAPGFDIEDIRRPRGSQRLVTFAQDHGGVRYSILIYRGQGSPDSVLDGFAHDMSEQGWAPSAAFERVRLSSGEIEPSLLMVKEGREAYISLRSKRRDGTVTSTVVVYDHGG